MSNNPNNNRNNTQNNLSNLISTIKYILTNPYISNLATKNILITNIVTTIILIYGGVDVFSLIQSKPTNENSLAYQENLCRSNIKKTNHEIENIEITEDNNNLICNYKLKNSDTKEKITITSKIKNQDEYVINKKDVCNKYRRKVEESLKPEQRINEIMAIEDTRTIRDSIGFHCKYDIVNNINPENSKRFYMLYNPIFSEYIDINHIEKEQITQTEMRNVCLNESYYKPKLYEENPSLKNTNKYRITFKELKLHNSTSEWKKILPAFRWKCVYNISIISNNNQGEPPEVQRRDLGLNLDDFVCKVKYRNRSLNKSTFLDYRDPYSFYCVKTREIN